MLLHAHWLGFVCPVHEHDSAAPRFVVFEAWAFLLLGIRRLPGPATRLSEVRSQGCEEILRDSGGS